MHKRNFCLRVLSGCATFFLMITNSFAQQTDSLHEEYKFIELSSAIPQPRLGESFPVAIDLSPLGDYILNSLTVRMRFSNNMTTMLNDHFDLLYCSPPKIGRYEIGPLQFVLNKTRYKTNKLVYDVIDSLPAVDKGLWIREVTKSDTTFCIIIEQRIPVTKKMAYTPWHYGDSTNNKVVKFTPPQITMDEIIRSVNGLSSGQRYSSRIIDGELKYFESEYSTYCYEIVDRSTKIKITKDWFSYLPKDYKFEEIIIK